MLKYQIRLSRSEQELLALESPRITARRLDQRPGRLAEVARLMTRRAPSTRIDKGLVGQDNGEAQLGAVTATP